MKKDCVKKSSLYRRVRKFDTGFTPLALRGENDVSGRNAFMKKARVAINGFGRIGRLMVRGMYDYDGEELFDIVATNSRSLAEQRAHLLKYDSVHRRFKEEVTHDENHFYINGKPIENLRFSDPHSYPWGDLGIDIVIEASGKFTRPEKALVHLERGAKKVILTAPSHNNSMKTIVMGVNEEAYDPSRDHMISNASCTTNCLAPVVKVLHENFGIRDGMMTTVHSYTNDQCTLDSAHSKFNRGRANAMSMIPTTTGAASAIGAVLPELDGRLHGIAIRVPTPDVSLVDLVADLEEAPTKETINEAMKKAAQGPMGKYLGYEEDQCVSMDYVGDPRSSIFAAPYTMVLGHKAKVLAWYDNEWGYACRCVDLTNFIIRQGL